MRRILSLIPVISCAVLAFSLTTLAQEAVPAPAPAAAPKAEAPAPAPAQVTEALPAPKADAPAPAPAAEAQPAPKAESPAPAVVEAPAPAPAAEAQPPRRTFEMRGMLPFGYKDFVTQDQKEEIYKIQEEYRVKFEELQNQMIELRKEMDQKIDAVLTPEQLEKARARKNEIQRRWNSRRNVRRTPE